MVPFSVSTMGFSYCCDKSDKFVKTASNTESHTSAHIEWKRCKTTPFHFFLSIFFAYTIYIFIFAISSSSSRDFFTGCNARRNLSQPVLFFLIADIFPILSKQRFYITRIFTEHIAPPHRHTMYAFAHCLFCCASRLLSFCIVCILIWYRNQTKRA